MLSKQFSCCCGDANTPPYGYQSQGAFSQLHDCGQSRELDTDPGLLPQRRMFVDIWSDWSHANIQHVFHDSVILRWTVNRLGSSIQHSCAGNSNNDGPMNNRSFTNKY
jgi:hypothetical protein